jgi:subtilase family serine protease
MHIWRIFSRNKIIVFVILHLTILSSFHYCSALYLQPKLEIKVVSPKSEILMKFPQHNYPRNLGETDQEIGKKILQVEDVDKAFNAIYNLVNPQAGLTGKNITIAILDSHCNIRLWN